MSFWTWHAYRTCVFFFFFFFKYWRALALYLTANYFFATHSWYKYNGTVTMIDRERWRKPGNFTWRKQLSSSLFTLSPFLVHHLINRGWQSMTVCVLEALRVCGLGVLVPSFDGFSSRRPLLVSHLLVRGICLPSLYALSFPLYGSFSSRAIGFKSVHKMALHVIIPVKGFLLRIYNSTPLSGKESPRPALTPVHRWSICVGPNSANLR